MILGLITSWIIANLWFKNNIIYRAPDSAMIRRQIYRDGDQCYRLIPQPVVGPLVYRVSK